MQIREIRKEDLGQIIEVISLCYKDSSVYADKMKKDLEESFSSDSELKPKYLVAIDSDKLVGFAGFARSRINYRIYEFFSLMVHPDFRNKGIGSMLINERIKIVKILKRKKGEKYRIHLTTLISDYLRKFGFKKIGKNLENGSQIMSLEV